MTLAPSKWPGYALVVWLTSAVLLLIGTLVWFGSRAVLGWRASAAQVAERRAGEVANLLVSALTRDMRGAQSAVLSSPQADEFMMDPPYDVSDVVAGAFARYPYPESFFAWRGAPSPESVIFFDRADRRPPWGGDSSGGSRFPVVIQSHPEVARLLIEQVEADASHGRRFSAFNLRLHGAPYQVVTRLLYRDALRLHLEAAFGFTVNLEWVRAHYFDELTRQVARIGNTAGLALFVVDDHEQRIVSVPSLARGQAAVRREFAMSFFDPVAVRGTLSRSWAVETAIAHDPTLADAVRAGNGTLVTLACAAAALAVGLILTLRAIRATARLAEIRSDFVSTVTHELKTPIATIRAIGDTLARERVTGPEARLEYAQLVVQESKRLSRLVDNLLAYSRITDVTEVYSFDAIDVHWLIEESLRGFRTHLIEKQFDVRVDVPADLPPIRADRVAMTLVLDNVIDNAIRYSGDSRILEISGCRGDGRVVLQVRDHGIGIPERDLDHVTQRFYRARGSSSGGSGLGLAIVERIAADHGGSLAIASKVNGGTSVSISLPVAEYV